MRRWLRLFPISLGLALFALTGCETKRIWVELPSFGDGSIDGVWLWRLDDASGEYVRHCHIPIGDVEDVSGDEAVYYEQECGDQRLDFDLFASVDRTPEDGSTVTLGLWYMRWEDPGTYKLSSHGVEGESALSETTLDL